jgi:hypothetical protein
VQARQRDQRHGQVDPRKHRPGIDFAKLPFRPKAFRINSNPRILDKFPPKNYIYIHISLS